MEIPEMLDELKQKALKDGMLRSKLMDTRKRSSLFLHFVRNAGNWGIRYMKWI